MKILYYIYGLNIGGAESFIYNVVDAIKTELYHIYFVLQIENNQNKRLIELLRKKGCKIYIISSFFKKPVKSSIELRKLAINYDAIHVHINALINISPILIGRLIGIPVIIHSHNTSSNKGFTGNLLHKINRLIWNKKIYRVACGVEAGRWMFGKKKFDVIDNGINLQKYCYSYKYRKEIRSRYGIGIDDIVIGNVGRLVKAKNHAFMLDCFQKFQERYNNAWLILVGDGELKKELLAKVQQLGIKNVIFAGNVSDTNKYYSAFDCMLFPSVFEGMPFTLIEAQASGVPIVASDIITRDVNITKNIEYVSLNEDIAVWCEIISNTMVLGNMREKNLNIMEGSIYDIATSVKKLEEIYKSLIGRRE